jgi:stearoyl-CoA desaturase (delta-9 desaturase)
MSPHAKKIIIPNYTLSCITLVYLLVDFQALYLYYAVAGYLLFGIFGNFIGFHRYLTHQSFSVNKFFHYSFILLGSLTGQGSPIFWTALHLHHHRTSDTADDIHSPLKGFWEASLLWQIRGNLEKLKGFIAPRSLYKDSFIKFLHHHYYKFYWSFGLLFLIIDVKLFLFFFVLGGFFFTALADNLSNYCFHSNRFGYVNFETKDQSRNVPMISLLTLGAGWHNNHHQDPKNYSFSKHYYELDPSAWLIKIIKK